MKLFSNANRVLKSVFLSKDRAKYIGSRFLYKLLPDATRLAVLARLGSARPFYCPICESPVSAFAPLAGLYFEELARHGSDLRITDFETCNFQSYQCVFCGATDRDRLYALFLANRLPSAGLQQDDFQLLDIAPAPALSKHIKRKYHIQYRTADLFQRNVDDRVDITSMHCYANSKFDALICSHVLEHVENDRKAMAELWRVLKPGGWGIVMVPIHLTLKKVREDSPKTSASERWKYFGQGDHVRVYSREGFVDRLREAGFNVLQLGCDYFDVRRMNQCGLSHTSVLYVVEKSLTIKA